ncbi:aldo/keto reductase family protein [Methylomonas methanica]|uniref:Aldo/keto reductase n=1 Tax=Methylomonas methanica (strain DSM 25384 / MC09) TaxID=857087 RepID=G0A2V4_METMM|nr:aldo/keto reductase [Methylomonas methanica]AEG01457.1 aldo/keto reductase [Methylomonas methanica MC09]
MQDDVVISSAGVAMPRLIYGTAWKKQRTAEWVALALEQGFRGIDTACQPKHYYEPGVGEALHGAFELGLGREQIYLQTKFTPLSGQDPQQVPYDPQAALDQQVVQSFKKSLDNLHTDYLDGLVLHSPLADRQQLMTVWRAMEAIALSGGARQLGISNCYDPVVFKSLYEAATVKPAVLQNRFYADTHYDIELRKFCRAHNVIYQSFWTLTANPGILANAVIVELADRYRRTPAQILFRYLTQIGVVPLTGTTSAQHMREDLAIFVFELTQDECAGIDRLLG